MLEENSSKKQVEAEAGSVGTFKRSLIPTLRMGQLVGLLPLQSAGYQLINVTSLLATSAAFVMASLCMYWFFRDRTVFRATKVIFYWSAVGSMLLLRQLAKSWPRLARSWRRAEATISHIGYLPHTARRCHILTALYVIIAVVEHVLAILHLSIGVRICPEGTTFYQFFRRWFPQLLQVVPYHPLLVPPALLLNTAATFTFNYLDLIIINVSYCLVSLLSQFNKHLMNVSDLELRPDWEFLYKDYLVLWRLVSETDSHISRLVLLTFFVDVYHICVNLYLLFSPLHSSLSRMYLAVSLTFLVLRVTGLCLVGSSINLEAARPKHVLFRVPPHEFTIEAERFLFQVVHDEVALTGRKFFTLTRGTLMTIVGLAITYELVLFQMQTFAEEEELFKKNSSELCD